MLTSSRGHLGYIQDSLLFGLLNFINPVIFAHLLEKTKRYSNFCVGASFPCSKIIVVFEIRIKPLSASYKTATNFLHVL